VGQPLPPPFTATDVQPRGGTLVVFQSRTLLHEVLPAFRRRFAITQW
jgi:Rps23 Pro-64 3,4-dihydroxylase Tpa1-like proline 4-hydroxylase